MKVKRPSLYKIFLIGRYSLEPESAPIETPKGKILVINTVSKNRLKRKTIENVGVNIE